MRIANYFNNITNLKKLLPTINIEIMVNKPIDVCTESYHLIEGGV